MRRLLLLALLSCLLLGHEPVARAVGGFGPLMPTSGAPRVVPVLPGTPTAFFQGSVGFVPGGSGYWTDHGSVGGNWTIYSGSPNLSSGAGINGYTSVNWAGAAGFTSGARTGASYLTTTNWTIAGVWKYTGSNTGSPSYSTTPVIMMDTGQYWGLLVNNQTADPTKVQISLYSYGSGAVYATATGASGSASNWHYSVAWQTGGTCYAQLDGGTASSLSCAAVGSLGSPIYMGSGSSNAFTGSIEELIVYNTAGGTLPVQLNTYLHLRSGI